MHLIPPSQRRNHCKCNLPTSTGNDGLHAKHAQVFLRPRDKQKQTHHSLQQLGPGSVVYFDQSEQVMMVMSRDSGAALKHDNRFNLG